MATLPFPEKSGPNAANPRLHNEIYPFIAPAKFKGALKDKVVLITGASGTLGAAMAESFAVAGARLVLVYNSTPPSDELKARCAELGATGVAAVRCNVSKLEECEALVKQVLETEKRIDVLINNAASNALVPLHLQDPKDYVYDIAVNLHGPYYLMRLTAPIFREQRSGVVLNIASRAGTIMGPWNASYCSSKAALINLTGCVQHEFDFEGFQDVHMYSIHPGGVKSKMTREKYAQNNVDNLPEKIRPAYDGWLDSYTDSPYLNGMTGVALAAGVAKDVLRGRYFDVEHDLGDVLAQAEIIKKNREIYSLHMTYPGTLPSAGAIVTELDEPFDFPGPGFGQ